MPTHTRPLVVTLAVIAIVMAVQVPDAARPAAGLAAQLRPGVLRGRVDIRRVGIAQTRPRVSDLASPPKPDPLDVRRAVVYLDALEVQARSPLRVAPAAPVAGARMDQRNETFVPGVLSVTAGTRVDFPNNDETFHNVFSLSKPKRFDLGRYGRGKSKTVHFTSPGVVRVFCDIHSHMSAFVLVFNHPYHATTDEAGRYAIENIPPGTYTVEAWHDGAARDSRSLTMTAGGVVDLDLLVQ